MMLNRKYILIPVLFLLACAPKRERVVFQISNDCADGLVCRYVVLSTNDTIPINFMAQYQTYILSDTYLPANETTNWYTDYPVHINYIHNFITGDSLNFNPNEALQWQLTGGSYSEHYYTLHISDASF